MKLFEKLFRPRPPIRDREALADFIDAQSAFIVQKGIYEYSRARAGHYAKVLFAEKEFAEAVEHARWQAFPLGLSMVGEMVDGVLASQAGMQRRANARPVDSSRPFGVRPLSRSSIDRRRGMAGCAQRPGASARSCRRPCPKRVMDIPEPLAEAYFAMMPIHEKLRGRDFQTTRNYLRVSLCNIHDELISRMDRAALQRALTTGAAA